jgi:hypothetical protein
MRPQPMHTATTATRLIQAAHVPVTRLSDLSPPGDQIAALTSLFEARGYGASRVVHISTLSWQRGIPPHLAAANQQPTPADKT